MKAFRKLISILLVLAMTAALTAGCGKKSGDTSDSSGGLLGSVSDKLTDDAGKSNYLYRPDDGAGDWIYEGVKTRADLTENSQKSGVMGVIFWGVLALVFLALSLWKFEVFEKLFSKNA